MSEDLWDAITAGAAEQAARENEQAERERRTMAELLLARGELKAAAIVAMSGYRSDCVDNWRGGVYEVVLAVPAAYFDRVDTETRAALEIAARDVTGPDHFSGLGVEVRLLDAEPGWEHELLTHLFGGDTRPDRALPPGGKMATGSRDVRLTATPAPPRSLSPTSASTWQQCELKYALSYLHGWREPSTMPQLVGNVVHRAVELLYTRDASERTRIIASELLSEALNEELERPTYAALLRAGDPRDSVTAAGEDALDGLFELEDPGQVTVGPDGLEVWVSAELYGAPIRGRIDRIYDASGAEVVADYKTGKVPSPLYTQKAFFGLWTYTAALAAADPDHRLADRIELLYLIGRERLSRPVLRDVALDQAKILARIWRQIGTTVETGQVTARRSKLCDWCAFKPACPAFGSAPAVGSETHNELLAAQGLLRSTRDDVATAVERLEPAAADQEDA